MYNQTNLRSTGKRGDAVPKFATFLSTAVTWGAVNRLETATDDFDEVETCRAAVRAPSSCPSDAACTGSCKVMPTTKVATSNRMERQDIILFPLKHFEVHMESARGNRQSM